jgi:hypothetical protein
MRRLGGIGQGHGAAHAVISVLNRVVCGNNGYRFMNLCARPD